MNDAGKKALFTSNSDEWATPAALFEELDREFSFTLDPCATEENHKTPRYFTKAENGLLQDWTGETVFCNPPYSDIAAWTRKAYQEASKQASKQANNYCFTDTVAD